MFGKELFGFSLQTVSTFVFVIFVAVMALLAIRAMREVQEGPGDLDEEYYLGGRGAGPMVLAFSYVTGSVSAAAFMGEPGMMASIGWPYYWIVIAIIPGMVFPAIALMRPMRKQSEQMGSLTIPDYLGQSYESDALRLIIAIAICISYLFPLVAQFKGAAVVLQQFTGIPFVWAVFIFTAIVAIYSATGGLRSALWTSVAQGVPMLFLSVGLVVVALKAVGGLNGIETKLAEIDPAMLNIFQERGPDAIFPIEGVIGIFAYQLIMFVSQPYLSSRFMSIQDTSSKTIGKFLISVLILTVAYNTLYLSGLGGRILYPNIEGDYITTQLAIDFLPVILSVFMMVGIFGAMLSTVQSMILVMAQAVGNDIYYKTMNPEANSEKIVKVTRISILVISAIVFVLTIMRTPEFLSLFFYYGLSSLGTSISVPLIAAVLWKGRTRQGAVASALLGPLVYLTLLFVLKMNMWFACLIAVIVAALAMVIISGITRDKNLANA